MLFSCSWLAPLLAFPVAAGHPKEVFQKSERQQGGFLSIEITWSPCLCNVGFAAVSAGASGSRLGKRRSTHPPARSPDWLRAWATWGQVFHRFAPIFPKSLAR